VSRVETRRAFERTGQLYSTFVHSPRHDSAPASSCCFGMVSTKEISEVPAGTSSKYAMRLFSATSVTAEPVASYTRPYTSAS
jgi:hypothetical protein